MAVEVGRGGGGCKQSSERSRVLCSLLKQLLKKTSGSFVVVLLTAAMRTLWHGIEGEGRGVNQGGEGRGK